MDTTQHSTRRSVRVSQRRRIGRRPAVAVMLLALGLLMGVPAVSAAPPRVHGAARVAGAWIGGSELAAGDAAAGDQFGTVALSGGTALVGAPIKDNFAGAAYVFVRSGAAWTQQAKLGAGDAAANDEFGAAVALSGSVALVGAPGQNGLTGAVYVFVRSGGLWVQQAKLTAADAAQNDNFGVSVALSGNTALIGADGKNGNAGAAYVFVRSGTSWTQQAELTPSDAASDAGFGISGALSGNTALIGAFYKDNFTGAAYVFTRNGTSWSQQAELTARDGAEDASFGLSVALDGRIALVGAPGQDRNSGAAYVFTRNDTTWTQRAELTAGDGALDDRFGNAVALCWGTAMVGAPGTSNGAGTVYVFTSSDPAGVGPATLTAGDGVSSSSFGGSLAASGGTALIGAPGANAGAGAAYVFVRGG